MNDIWKYPVLTKHQKLARRTHLTSFIETKKALGKYFTMYKTMQCYHYNLGKPPTLIICLKQIHVL